MNGTSIAALVAWGVISIFGFGFLIWLMKDEEKDDMGGYDERQILARGKATQAGLIAGVGYLLIIQLAELWESFPLSIQEVCILGILVMLITYETVAIWKDAYVRVREKENRVIGWEVFLGSIFLLGRFSWLELIMGFSCLYSAALIALRRHMRKLEEREEDDG